VQEFSSVNRVVQTARRNYVEDITLTLLRFTSKAIHARNVFASEVYKNIPKIYKMPEKFRNSALIKMCLLIKFAKDEIFI